MDVNNCLNKYYESIIKINRSDRSDALRVWEPLVKDILGEVQQLDERFSFQRMLYTGSFYERLKTEAPNEFDLMLVLEKMRPEMRKKVVVHGFTFIYISDPEKLQWSRDRIVDSDGRLDAVQMRAVFARLVQQAISKTQGKHPGKSITRTTHGPAVTLNIKIGQNEYDVDLTLAIKLPAWPPAATTWKTRSRRGWPSPELISQVHQGGCHVVAKQPPLAYTGEDKKYLWRFSCSEGEKTILKNIDSGSANSDRKRVLQILKSIVANDPQLKNVPLSSYHIKTLIFWESERYPKGEDWHASKLQERFFGAFEKLVSFVSIKKSFPHYFLNNVNLVEQFKESHVLIVSKKYEEIRKDPQEYFRSAIQRGSACRM